METELGDSECKYLEILKLLNDQCLKKAEAYFNKQSKIMGTFNPLKQDRGAAHLNEIVEEFLSQEGYELPEYVHKQVLLSESKDIHTNLLVGPFVLRALFTGFSLNLGDGETLEDISFASLSYSRSDKKKLKKYPIYEDLDFDELEEIGIYSFTVKEKRAGLNFFLRSLHVNFDSEITEALFLKIYLINIFYWIGLKNIKLFLTRLNKL